MATNVCGHAWPRVLAQAHNGRHTGWPRVAAHSRLAFEASSKCVATCGYA